MVFLFDTSAVNQLHDDPDGSALLTGLIATNCVWVSALNVGEAGGTQDLTRRRSLLRLLKRMTGERRPLEVPTFLIRRSLAAYAKRAPYVDYTVGPENAAMWQVLANPALLDDRARAKLQSRLRNEERGFENLHRRARPHFQQLFADGAPRPVSASALLRQYAADQRFLAEIVRPLYRGAVGSDLPAGEAISLLRAVPELASFLLAWGHAAYRRAMSGEGYGSGNAGNIDLWFATYLPRVHRFITADLKQYQALRLIARFTAPQCRVLRYASLRKGLLIEAGP